MRDATLERTDIVKWIRQTFNAGGAYADKEHEAHGSLGYGWVHYGIIRTMRPTRILAIGSRHGFIPACLALAVKDAQRGHVDFVDANYSKANPNTRKAAFDGVGWWSEHSFGPLDAYVSMHLMRTDGFFAQHAATSYGYIHVDGGHDEATVRHDVRESAKRLTRGGFLALHDSHAERYKVRDVVKDLREAGWSGLEFPALWGLSILQKP